MTFKYFGKPNDYSRSIIEDLKDKKQLAAFQTFKDSIQDIWRSDFEDDFYLFKWVKARQFDARKAERMLRDHLQWREAFRADYILQEFSIPEAIQRYYTGGFCGVDKQGRPVWYDPVGYSDPEGMFRSASKEDLVKSRVYICELTHNRIEPSLRHSSGLPVYQITVVYDFENFSKKHLLCGMEFYQQLIKTCEANYPESVGRIYVINAPSIFNIAYNLMKPLLHADTQKKVNILGNNYKEALLEVIDADQLPAIHGGLKTDPDGNPKCRTWICYGGDIPKEYFLQPNHSHLEEIAIGRKSYHKLQVEVKKPNSFIEWELVTDEGDIGIEIYSHNDVISEEKIYVLQNQKEDCAMVPWSGHVKCPNPGLYTIKLDNSHSWVKSKVVRYFAAVWTGQPPTYTPNYEAKYMPNVSKPIIPHYIRDFERVNSKHDLGESERMEPPKRKRMRGSSREFGSLYKETDGLSVASYYTAASHLSDDNE